MDDKGTSIDIDGKANMSKWSEKTRIEPHGNSSFHHPQ